MIKSFGKFFLFFIFFIYMHFIIGQLCLIKIGKFFLNCEFLDFLTKVLKCSSKILKCGSHVDSEILSRDSLLGNGPVEPLLGSWVM